MQLLYIVKCFHCQKRFMKMGESTLRRYDELDYSMPTKITLLKLSQVHKRINMKFGIYMISNIRN